MTHKPPKLTPNQMRKIYSDLGGDETFSTFTQIAKLVEYPPGEHSVFFWYKGTIIVGATAVDKVALDTWRRKYTMKALPKMTYTPTEPRKKSKGELWAELHNQGWTQADIARELEVTPAYCSILKKRFAHLVDKVLQ